MKKILWIILMVVVAFLVLVAIIGFFYLGTIVKSGIEEYGPQMAKVSVSVGAVNVSVLSGSASLKNLVIGNPQGYSNPQAINVGNIAVSLDPFSVASQKILIHSVRVDSPEITFEAGLGGNNLSKILSNLNGPTANNSQPGPKIEIDDFVITGAKVNVAISGVGSKVLPLPTIHLTDLGKGSNGLTPVEITKAILRSLVTATLKAVTGSVGSINQAVSGLTSSLGSLFSK